MVYHGHVRNGRVELDNGDALPEGAEVRVLVITRDEVDPGGSTRSEPLGRKLLRHAGTATGLPSDLARNHDHYLYGSPKR
jgi:hypothetical protein